MDGWYLEMVIAHIGPSEVCWVQEKVFVAKRNRKDEEKGTLTAAPSHREN